jgi:hypothetical protein
MRYMMFIKHTEDYRNADVPASLYEEMGKFIEEDHQKRQLRRRRRRLLVLPELKLGPTYGVGASTALRT